MSSASSLTGEWQGTYVYAEGEAVPFVAKIEEADGALSGDIIEPHHSLPGKVAVSILQGVRSGGSVDFTKTYRGAGEYYRNPVDYTGLLADDGLSISGVWVLLDSDGKFEMHRDAVPEPARVAEEVIEISVE